MHQGFVYRDNSNILCAKVISVPDNTAARPSAANIIFMARSEHREKLQASVDAVCQIAQQIEDNGKFLTVPPVESTTFTAPDEYYVYVYTRKPDAELQRWSDCFYIGKGKTKRWTEHVSGRAKDAAKGIPPKGAKQIAVQSWINGFPGLNSTKLVNKAAGSFVRKVGAWRGEYAEVKSFAVEHFLIAHHLGPHAIANETGGNMKNGVVYALARPAVFDQDNAVHKAYWEGTVEEFCRVPLNKKDKSLWKPALLLLHAEKMIDELDAQLASVGITPFDMRGHPKLSPNMMLHDHCQVEGSSDAAISYAMPGQSQFRLQLKVSATKNEVGINMRPQKPGASARKEFLKYLGTLALEGREIFGHRICSGNLMSLYGKHEPIKHPNGEPFFKPFAQDAVGGRSPGFDINDLSMRSKTSTTNWVEGEISLTLIEAMVMIFDTFRHTEGEEKMILSAQRCPIPKA